MPTSTLGGQITIVTNNDWTPFDNSGAGLMLTSGIVCSWVRIGPILFFWLNVAYPVTADVRDARIGGLPTTAPLGASAIVGQGPIPIDVYLDAGDLIFFDPATGAALTNADLSGLALDIGGWLAIAGQVANNNP